MIEFTCPNCENLLKVADNLAGRDGWCRVCKRWIVIPMGSGKGSPMDSMTVEEKYERLEYMLQYAATKADNPKGLLSKYCDENGNLIPADTARFRRNKRDKFENRLKRSEQDICELADAVRNAKRERDEAIADRDRLQGDLHGLEERVEDRVAELEAPDSTSIETDVGLGKLRIELDAVRTDRDAAQSDRENLADRIVRLEEELSVARASSRGLSKKMEALQRDADGSKSEREEIEALQRTIDSLSVSDTELRRNEEKLAKELVEVREEADRLQGELAAAEKSARNGNSNGSTDLSSAAMRCTPLSVEGELVNQLGDPLMDSYLRFLHTKPATDEDSSDE